MKVDIIVAGVQKCGTTALHNFLGRHPKIIGSDPKEPHFFNQKANFEKGFEHYHSAFAKRPVFSAWRGYKFMEASASYISDMEVELVADRIFKYNKHVKMISLVRDPVKRAFSAWKMYQNVYRQGQTEWWIEWVRKRRGFLPENIERRIPDDYNDFGYYIRHEIEALSRGMIIECPVLKLGFYTRGIRVFKEVFGNNYTVIKNEEMNRDTPRVLEKLNGFLGLVPHDWSSVQEKKIFTGGYSDAPDETVVKELGAYYKESNEELFQLTGIDYRV